MKDDTKTFVNPVGYWVHEGAFSVELVDLTVNDVIPANAQIHDKTVVVTAPGSRAYQAMGGIQLISGEKAFYFRYSGMKSVRDASGNLIWVNNNYR